jgi:hypothetical protein
MSNKISLSDVKSAVLSYHKEYGKRPTTKAGAEWANRDALLRKQGQSLASLCNDLALPGATLDRTLDEAKAAVQSYFKEHGTAPSAKSGSEWSQWDQWLRRQGSSLKKIVS